MNVSVVGASPLNAYVPNNTLFAPRFELKSLVLKLFTPTVVVDTYRSTVVGRSAPVV